MNPVEQERFDRLYADHMQALKLQGKRGKSVDCYARAVRRIAGYFDRCPDDLSTNELKGDQANHRIEELLAGHCD